MAQAGINDDPVENIDLHRHKRSSHRPIAKFKCFYFTELPAVYYVHGVTSEDRCQRTEDRSQMAEFIPNALAMSY